MGHDVSVGLVWESLLGSALVLVLVLIERLGWVCSSLWLQLV